MLGQKIIPRQASALFEESVADSPVTLIHGPRQCGKTTLALGVGRPLGYTYFTFDDPDARAAAQYDPLGFVNDCPDRTILDEVQLVPEVFRAIKLSVDRRRIPGRYILTGSTNLLLIPNLADTLAGRMQIVRLHPLSQLEINRSQSPSFLQKTV